MTICFLFCSFACAHTFTRLQHVVGALCLLFSSLSSDIKKTSISSKCNKCKVKSKFVMCVILFVLFFDIEYFVVSAVLCVIDVD